MTDGQYTKRQKESLKLWIELLRYSNKLEQIIDDKLRQNYGQNISRFDVLSQLARAKPEGLTIGELAGQLIASKGNITGLLDRMQKDGLIEKETKKNDRRSYLVRHTKKGNELFAEMAEKNAQWVETALEDIDIDHMKEFAQFLSKSRNSLD